jgi:NADH-quinone oxidoreductase subunit N
MLAIVITGMVVLMADLVLARDKKSPLVLISGIGAFISAFLAFICWDRQIVGFGGTISADGFSLLFQMVLLVALLLSVLLSESYIQQKGINHGEYYALMLFSTSGAMLMAASRELIVMFIGLEILSIALYVLSGFARTEEKSEEAAVKYLLLGAFSSGFFLYGIALVYGGVHSTLLSALSVANGTPGTVPVYIAAGIAFLLIGLCFKAAIVPFHSWTPDVYQGAPTSVTAFMSVTAKLGAFAALISVAQATLPLSALWRDTVWGLAAATMIVGNVVALWQTDIKRMLAYSSIAHAGYILVGVLAANVEGHAAVLFYMLIYALMNLGAFGIVMLLGKTGEEFNAIADLDGLGHKQPLAASFMAIFMLSLAGIPPLAGFVGKFLLFQAAINAGYVGLAVVGLLASVVGVYYYLSVIVRMWMVPAKRDFGPLVWAPGTAAVLGIASVALVFLILVPSRLIENVLYGASQLNVKPATVSILPAHTAQIPMIRPILVARLPYSRQ